MLSFKNISLRSKLIIIQLATAFLAVLFCCGIFVYNDIKFSKESSIRNKKSIAEIIGVNAAPTIEFADADAANAMLAKLKSNPTIINISILDKQGKEFARYNKTGEAAFVFPAPDSEAEQKTREGFDPRYVVNYKIIEKEYLGTVLLHAEMTDYKAIILTYLRVAGLILLTSLAVALVISTILQRSITHRLQLLVNKTNEVSQTGNYSIRAPSGGNDEIGTLSVAYNDMLEHIEKMQHDLHDANVELEARVKRRTAELQNANNALEVKTEELSRSNQELGQYAYVASHDLQEPLRTITNYVGLLEEKYTGQTDEETQLYIRFIVKSATTMRTLISHLLEFSRIGRNVVFVPVDCNKMLKELLDDMGESVREAGVNIVITPLPTITANAIELRQLFQNLISNAIKFRKRDTQPEIRIKCTEGTAEWLFSVKDNGIGMEKKYQDKIFVIFQRLHNSSEYPGTGIGLATCKKIVSLHGGIIWVESSPGEGSTFFFTISKNLKQA